MSIHSSFRMGSTLTKHRNVLTRTERIEKLEAQGHWDGDKDSILGLPKVRSIKVAVKKKKKKEEAATEEVTTTEASAAEKTE